MAAQPDVYTHYQQSILMLAGEMHAAHKAGVVHPIDIDPQQRTPDEVEAIMNRLIIVPPDASESGSRVPINLALAETRIELAARTVATLASLEDDRERGGVRGLVAAVEIRARHILERGRLKGGLGEITVINAIRNNQPAAEAA